MENICNCLPRHTDYANGAILQIKQTIQNSSLQDIDINNSSNQLVLRQVRSFINAGTNPAVKYLIAVDKYTLELKETFPTTYCPIIFIISISQNEFNITQL